MQHKELKAPVTLSDIIADFWYLEQDFGDTPSAFEVLPDGHAEIIFHFGSGLSQKKQDTFDPLPSPFIVGMLGQPVHFFSQGKLKIVGIKCFPWAVYDLLNLPSVKGGVHLFEHAIAGLQLDLKILVDRGEVDEALNLLCRWVINSRSGIVPPAQLSKAGMAMLNSNGNLPVTALAEAAHATVRTLERKFKASSGNTLKEVSGLLRFENARNCLWTNPDTGIVGLAHELGYADQSHLNREFKRYSGITAAAFARQTKVRKRALGDDFVAIVLSA
jgi:AraC-like DNA-binding protein